MWLTPTHLLCCTFTVPQHPSGVLPLPSMWPERPVSVAYTLDTPPTVLAGPSSALSPWSRRCGFQAATSLFLEHVCLLQFPGICLVPCAVRTLLISCGIVITLRAGVSLICLWPCGIHDTNSGWQPNSAGLGSPRKLSVTSGRVTLYSCCFCWLSGGHSIRNSNYT